MREPPPHVSDAQVLETVRRHWGDDVTAVEHLPVGFGAHHWRADTDDGPRWFVTFDPDLPNRTGAELEATYAAAADLDLPFVIPSAPAVGGDRTVALADGRASVTDWRAGSSGDGPLRDWAEAEETAAILRVLHEVPAPADLSTGARACRTASPPAALLLGRPWDTGPYGERARTAIAERIDEVGRWTAAYHRLADRAADLTWVVTHGEPHTANHLVTPDGRFLVDWETLRRSPAERDLKVLVENGYADLCDPDWDMVEMFDLEWRLDEIDWYARWFAAPHTGTASDRIAFGGLLGELEREALRRPE